jgi:hypothetical protein
MSDDITYWEVHLEDEIPTFGAGKRRLLVVERGQKWVTLLSPADCSYDKSPIAIWDRLKPVELLLPAWNYQEVAVRLARTAEEYDRNSATYRLAMKLLGFPVPEPELSPEQKAQRAAAAERLNAAKVEKVYVPGEGEKPGQNEGSGKLMQRLWMTGSYTPERLVEIVLSNWPGRTTKKSDVKYNYNILMEMSVEDRQARFGRGDVPPWPEKDAKPVVKAEPAPAEKPKKKGKKK